MTAAWKRAVRGLAAVALLAIWFAAVPAGDALAACTADGGACANGYGGAGANADCCSGCCWTAAPGAAGVCVSAESFCPNLTCHEVGTACAMNSVGPEPTPYCCSNCCWTVVPNKGGNCVPEGQCDSPIARRKSGPIVIDGDEALRTHGMITRRDPDEILSKAPVYVVSGLHIGPGTGVGVTIRNTTLPVLVHDNTIEGWSDAGIDLQNAPNVTIENNVLRGNQIGIRALGNPHLEIVDNLVFESSVAGMRVAFSTGLSVTGNTIWSSQETISLYDCRDAVVEGNQVTYSGEGITITGQSPDQAREFLVANNTVRNVHHNSMTFISVAGVIVVGNLLVDNVDEGIEILSWSGRSRDFMILRNTIIGSRDSAILVEGLEGALDIHENDISGNATGVILGLGAADVRVTNNRIAGNVLPSSTARPGVGISVFLQGSIEIERNVIERHRVGIEERRCWGDCRFEANELTGNDTGILPLGITASRSCHNAFAGNGVAIDGRGLASGLEYDAVDNWWGDASGPSSAGGSGEAVAGPVRVVPFQGRPLATPCTSNR